MASDLTYRDLESRWKALRGARGDLRVREVACVNAPRTLLCAEIGDAALPTIALSAGVHGDEPAGPWALLELVDSSALDPRFSYRIWPCTNPTGLDAGTRDSIDGVDVNRTFGRGGTSPEAKAILTANRDRRFVLSIDLHEDCDASGFYCYEYGGGDLGNAAAAAVEAQGYAIDPMRVIRPDAKKEAAEIGGISYTLELARRTARHALTLETPATHNWSSRLAMHRTAVIAIIGALAGA